VNLPANTRFIDCVRMRIGESICEQKAIQRVVRHRIAGMDA
jgi:hypothetical protein